MGPHTALQSLYPAGLENHEVRHTYKITSIFISAIFISYQFTNYVEFKLAKFLQLIGTINP